jgi:hypothetical protein
MWLNTLTFSLQQANEGVHVGFTSRNFSFFRFSRNVSFFYPFGAGGAFFSHLPWSRSVLFSPPPWWRRVRVEGILLPKKRALTIPPALNEIYTIP